MADIRKRKNSNGSVSYQVRYPSSSAKSGYVYKSFGTAKEARAFREDSRNRDLPVLSGKIPVTGITRSLEAPISRPFPRLSISGSIFVLPRALKIMSQ